MAAKVDLITGFLGAGKTTFIGKYLDVLKKQGRKAYVIENEFGMLAMDEQLLKEEGCEDIGGLTGECMCCTGKEHFEEMLVDAAEQGYDRIVVEPSGIYDVQQFFRSMEQAEVKKTCRIGMILTIVDPDLSGKHSEDMDFLMYTQLEAAGTVLMSKVQMAAPGQTEKDLETMNRLMERFGSSRRFDSSNVVMADWDQLTEADFLNMQNSGWHENKAGAKGNGTNHREIFGVEVYGDYCKDEEDLKERIRTLFHDSSFGSILRVKGHICGTNGQTYLINSTPDVLKAEPCRKTRGVFAVIGQGLDHDRIGACFIPRVQAKKMMRQNQPK
ncbi:MAG: GTP-binding protein [Eubacterium sp.]|nr:GTP-binding protein [Eubacterium sp.]